KGTINDSNTILAENMSILTVPSAATPEETLAKMDAFASSLSDWITREAREAFAHTLAAGRDVGLVPSDDTVTASPAAQIVGVSRAHLYKVLDAGAIPFVVVGKRDRRISLSDLTAYVERTEAARRDAARSVAKRRDNRALALDEME